jgi:hypothetical protein
MVSHVWDDGSLQMAPWTLIVEDLARTNDKGDGIPARVGIGLGSHGLLVTYSLLMMTIITNND